MAYRLVNVSGRAALLDGPPAPTTGYHDLETVSDGRLGSDPMSALGNLEEISELDTGLAGRRPTGTLADVELGAPVPRPGQVFGVGLNYRDHAEEGGADIPDLPLVFTKFPSCISPPDTTIELRSDHCDYEGELVAVIGSGGRDIAADDAWAHVAGFCVGQDVSDRAVQFSSRPAQFSLGKSFDTYGPIGPAVVSLDLLADPADLELTTEVDGEIRQHGRTTDLIFDVPALVAYLSHIVELQPGDLVFTGTPGGVGMARGSLLRHGDVVTTTIEGLGTITNRCVRVADHPEASRPLDVSRR